MTQTKLVALARTISWLGGVFLCASWASAQSFSGNNPPGGSQDFPITINSGTTNIAMSVAGTTTSFSHLLLKSGSPPSDSDFDFIAAADGQGNAINLELPELKLTNYFLRVRTPANSLAHNFTVTVLTNQVELRGTNLPATKPIVFTSAGRTTQGTWQFFRVDITTNISGWRLSIETSTNVLPDLYIQRGQLPTDINFRKQSRGVTNDVLVFSGDELTPGQYYIGVNHPNAVAGTNRYTLRAELISITTLNWDPGLTHLGTEVVTNSNPAGGEFYFKISTVNSSVGAWRTALNVSTGEAGVFLSKGTPPSTYSFQYRSERPGSDGFVVPASAFSAGEDWYFLVVAATNSMWTFITGDAYVANLGFVATDGSSGSGNVPIGAEGIRYFKTEVPASALAWRLWLQGSTNTLMVKRTSVPHPTLADLTQVGQMLVVPTNLVGGVQYFVGVVGTPGAIINLDSRQHSDQLAWQVSVVVSNGNPNVAVRRNFIPSEFVNDAFSEVASNITDSVTLVPTPAGSPAGLPGLGDGAYFITVYGTNASSTNAFTFTLQSGNPEVTDINFASTTTNTDTNRAGWRFFRVTDIAAQLGALGWDLLLTNHAPNTRIALRRNAVPGIWTYRSPGVTTSGYYDYLSTGPFLQRPGHQADIWYVGVYNPTNSLRNFTLIARPLTADPIEFDNTTVVRSGVDPAKWQFFRAIVPTDALGWDVRISEASFGSPQLVIRRDLLPDLALSQVRFSPPVTPTNWNSGIQWVAGKDWTDRDISADGGANESGRILSMGMGRPLETGTYYIGVFNSGTNSNGMTFTLRARGIGDGYSIPVNNLDYAGGFVDNVSLAAREVAYYRVVVPSNSPSWKVRLAPIDGDVVLAASRGALPNISAAVGNTSSVTNSQTAGKKMRKDGNEHLVLLPPQSFPNNPSNLIAGTYYLAVASEGQVVTNFPTRIGLGDAVYRLDSIGPMPRIDLGLLDVADLVVSGQLEGGEAIAYYFSNLPDTLGLVITLEDIQGYPVVVSRSTPILADPGADFGNISRDFYGNEGGGYPAAATAYRLWVSGVGSTETLIVKARSPGSGYPDARYTLRVHKIVPTPVDFDGGAYSVSDQAEEWRFYRISVPDDALGWDLRVVDVQAGTPQIIVKRDSLALLPTCCFDPGNDHGWPSGARWAAAGDWTRRALEAEGIENEDSRILAMGMGRPLSPGTYYVSVRTAGTPLTIGQYTLRSRGIGGPYSIPVVDLPFLGGVHTNLDLPPREAAYYRVRIPSDEISWQLKLTSLGGENMLVVLTNNVPSVVTGYGTATGRVMKKPGNEHYVLLAAQSQTNLYRGSNYIAVVSEGVVTTNIDRIGVGVSSFVLQSLGPMEVVQLGMAGAAELVHTAALEGGQVRGYQFNVPADTLSLEIRLEYTNGSPSVAALGGSYFPDPGAATSGGGTGAVPKDKYGNEDGYPAVGQAGVSSRLVTIANPTNTVFSVAVKNRDYSGIGASTNFNYTLRVRAIPAIILEADGGTYTVTNQVAGNWRYFRVEVPPEALGWVIRLASVGAGQPQIVVRRDSVPTALSTVPWSSPGVLTNWRWGWGVRWSRAPTTSVSSTQPVSPTR